MAPNGAPASPFPRKMYNELLGFRDYWNHTGDQLPPPKGPFPYRTYTEKNLQGESEEVPYVGQLHLCTVGKPFAAIGVSMPIYRDPKATPREMVGLLVACVNIDSFNNWLGRLEQEDGCVVLLDRYGFCVHHRKDLRELYVPKPGENPQSMADAAPAYTRVLHGEQGRDLHHRDPFDGRVYTATFQPVDTVGWGVIVQYDRDRDKVRAELGNANVGLYGLLWGGLAPGAVLILAFWGWLVWTLRHKEAVAHGSTCSRRDRNPNNSGGARCRSAA